MCTYVAPFFFCPRVVDSFVANHSLQGLGCRVFSLSCLPRVVDSFVANHSLRFPVAGGCGSHALRLGVRIEDMLWVFAPEPRSRLALVEARLGLGFRV